jgi:LmbE family N-acetylglucosaminyl deacetylase
MKRTLVLTNARRAAAIRAQHPDATILTEAASLGALEGPFDAALIDGMLEDEPWDRWLLQRVHRLLRMDARIVVAVPPLISLGSAIDFRFLAYAARRVLQRLVQRWRPALELSGAVHRRYHLPQLVRKMESAGYSAFEAGPGWWSSGSAIPPGLAWRSTLTARKAAKPRAQGSGQRFADLFAGVPAAREAWLAAFPEFRGLTPRALEPPDWREARVLVLSPHPDDELIGCGGTLCRLICAGAKVTVLQATDGSKLESLRDLPEAGRKTVRLEESARVASALGASLVLWRQEDGALRCSGETIAGLARLLSELRPTHVFTPFLGDPHGDHRTVSLILGAALEAARLEPQVLQYEVWSLVPANLYCDITGQAGKLESLLLLYERAMRFDNFVHFCERRNLARGNELPGRPAYAEAFLSTTSARFRRLAELTAEGRCFSPTSLVAAFTALLRAGRTRPVPARRRL